jgi:hypothetical protein
LKNRGESADELILNARALTRDGVSTIIENSFIIYKRFVGCCGVCYLEIMYKYIYIAMKNIEEMI